MLEYSHIGLMCYLDRDDFQNSVPNKVVDYLRAGMRILTNITGDMVRLTEGTDIVIGYKAGDIKDLVKVISRLLADKEPSVQNSQAARAIFEEHFRSDHVLADFETFLEKGLQDHRSLLSLKTLLP